VARERAKALVAEREPAILSPRDWNAFLTAMDKPNRRRPKLAAAAGRFLKRRGDVRWMDKPNRRRPKLAAAAGRFLKRRGDVR
jgi:uncharacterized protein (DUF1778 family)